MSVARCFFLAARKIGFAAAAGGEGFELIIGQFKILLIGELHDLIHIFTVSELLLLFFAQLSKDPFQ